MTSLLTREEKGEDANKEPVGRQRQCGVMQPQAREGPEPRKLGEVGRNLEILEREHSPVNTLHVAFLPAELRKHKVLLF